jgi:cytidylate kinase
MGPGRSVELLVEDQARRWQFRSRDERGSLERGVVTLSYLPGAPGEEVARRVSEALGFDLFDREIIREIARSAHLSERVVAALDERGRSWLSDWLGSLSGDAYLSTYGYLHQLRLVVGAVARHGGAVIVGHGAHVMLGPERALRVLVVAPFEERVASVAAVHGLRPAAARARVLSEESERQYFLERHFHARLRDPEQFDLVVNTGTLGTSGAVGAIEASARRFEACPAGA